MEGLCVVFKKTRGWEWEMWEPKEINILPKIGGRNLLLEIS